MPVNGESKEWHESPAKVKSNSKSILFISSPDFISLKHVTEAPTPFPHRLGYATNIQNIWINLTWRAESSPGDFLSLEHVTEAPTPTASDTPLISKIFELILLGGQNPAAVMSSLWYSTGEEQVAPMIWCPTWSVFNNQFLNQDRSQSQTKTFDVRSLMKRKNTMRWRKRNVACLIYAITFGRRHFF